MAPIQSMDSAAEDPSANICYFFAYNGQCASGDECTFSHVVEREPPESALNASQSQPEDANDADPSEPKADGKKPSRTCVFWKRGRCKRGQQCKYTHVEVRKGASLGRNSRQSVASFSSRKGSSEHSESEESSVPPAQLAVSKEEPDAVSSDGVSELRRQNDGPHEDDETSSKPQTYDELKQEGEDKDRRLTDAEPTVESTMHLFEPEVAGQQEQDQDQEQERERDQTSLAIDYHVEEREDNTQLDHPEESGHTSLDTITPDDYARADNMDELDPEKQDKDSIPDFNSMENDHPDTAEDDQGSQKAHGHDEIKAPHWTEYADPHANPFVAFCKFFARGRCRNGELCTYRHALTVQEFFLLFRLEPLIWSSQIPVPEQNFQELASVEPPLQQPVEQPVQPSSSSLGACAFYPLGKCRNGDKCPYSHIYSPDAEPKYGEQGTDGWDEPNSHDWNDWKAGSRKPCKYFVNYGSCRIGIDCKFSHEKDDSSSWHNAEDNEPQAWDQDNSAASGNQGAEEYTSAGDWHPENQNDKSPSGDGDGSNKSADNGWNDNEGQGGTDQWDETKWGKGNGQRDSSGWDATAGGNSETSRKGNHRRIAICRHYMRGSCRRSDCRYAHETDDTAHHDWNKDDWVTRNPLPSNDGWAGKDDHDNWGGNETKDTATRGNEWDAPSTTSRQGRQGDRPEGVCWAYLRGACYRATCRFAHESADNQLDGDNDDQANTWDSSQNRSGDPCDPQPSEPNTDSWHQTGYTSSYASSGRPREACLYFGQGYCQKGDSCPLLHVQSDDILRSEEENQEISEEQKVEGEESAYEDITTERSMYNCTVVFGAGGHVQHALTATDPNRIILKNLPSDVSPRELEQLPVNGLLTVHVDKSTKSTKASMEFDTKQQTLSALKVLNDYEFEGSTLSAHLYTDQTLDSDHAVMNCEVKVTWPAACKTAWARYGTVTLAKEDATRLDGQIFQGRKIKASYLPAKKGQTGMFSVQINNLPAASTSVSIQEMCTGCQYVNVTAPTYVSSPMEPIKEILGKYGVLTAFDILDVPASEEMVAFAKFQTSEAATAAGDGMRRLKVDFLGTGGILKVNGIHHSRFDIQPEQFRYIEGDLDKYRDVYNGQCSILVVPDDCGFRIHVFAAWTEATAFAKLLASLDTLFHGDVMKQDGVVVWDDYFDLASSAKVIDAVNAENSKDYNILIVPDHRAQRIHILGEQLNRPRAKESILKILKKVRVAWNEVPLDRFFVRWYLEKGQDLIQSEPDVGKNKVTLDLVDSKLIVKGDSKVLNKVKEIISNAVTILRESLDEGSPDICHICLVKSISPIILPCEHGYCKQCLSTLLASAVENIHTPLKCIAEIGPWSRCNQDIPYVTIRDLLPLADEERLLRAYFLSYVRSNMEGLFFCPSLRCEAVHRQSDTSTNLHCSACMMEICSSCQTKCHAGVSCDQWREIVSIVPLVTSFHT